MRVFLCLAMFLGVSIISATAAEFGPFFAMDTGTRDKDHSTPASQVALLKELGYAGIGWTAFNELDPLLQALDTAQLRLNTIYLETRIGPDGFEYGRDAFREGMAKLKGRDVILWVMINSDKFAKSDEAGDTVALAMLKEMADMAAPAGARIALYPHTNCWMERVEDCVRLADKAGRKDVGVTFNLCHWLRVCGPTDLDRRLALAAPHLMCVTVNGADKEGDWDRLIRPLGEGEYDTELLLAALRRINYAGPVGLQGYGIKGPVADNLRRSMTAWKKLNNQNGPK